MEWVWNCLIFKKRYGNFSFSLLFFRPFKIGGKKFFRFFFFLSSVWERYWKSMEFDSDLGAETLKFIYRDSFSFGCLVFVEWTSPADYATRPRNEFKSGFASVHFNVVTGVRKVLPSHFMLSSLIVLIIQLERIQICVCFGSILSPPLSLHGPLASVIDRSSSPCDVLCSRVGSSPTAGYLWE